LPAYIAGMDEATAQTWLQIVGVAMAVLWAIGHWFVRRTAAQLQGVESTGTVELPGEVAELQRRAAAALVRGVQGSALQQIRIESTDDDRLRWTCAMPMVRHSGELAFTAAAPGRTRAAWRLLAQPPVLRFARWFTLGGAAVVLGLFVLLREFALPSPTPAARSQVLQMAQAIHVLWPPFLIAGLTRAMYRRVGADLDRMLHNLPHDTQP
jgi:hypothetical protein